MTKLVDTKRQKVFIIGSVCSCFTINSRYLDIGYLELPFISIQIFRPFLNWKCTTLLNSKHFFCMYRKKFNAGRTYC